MAIVHSKGSILFSRVFFILEQYLLLTSFYAPRWIWLTFPIEALSMAQMGTVAMCQASVSLSRP